MRATPITARCHDNFTKRLHACFGISPFNSYFSEEKIGELAAWGLREFQAIHFFVPDAPSAFTLEALGYSPEKAQYKARRQCQYLTNKIIRALGNLGISITDAKEMLLSWPALAANPCYKLRYQEITELYEADLIFRKACLDASRWVLEKRVPDTDALGPEVLESAVRYLLAEMPLFVDSAGIVGFPSSVFVYHQIPKFLENLMSDIFALKVAPEQGYVRIESLELQVTGDELLFNNDISATEGLITA